MALIGNQYQTKTDIKERFNFTMSPSFKTKNLDGKVVQDRIKNYGYKPLLRNKFAKGMSVGKKSHSRSLIRIRDGKTNGTTSPMNNDFRTL